MCVDTRTSSSSRAAYIVATRSRTRRSRSCNYIILERSTRAPRAWDSVAQRETARNGFKNKSNSLASIRHGLIDKPLNRRRRTRENTYYNIYVHAYARTARRRRRRIRILFRYYLEKQNKTLRRPSLSRPFSLTHRSRSQPIVARERVEIFSHARVRDD